MRTTWMRVSCGTSCGISCGISVFLRKTASLQAVDHTTFLVQSTRKPGTWVNTFRCQQFESARI